MQIRYDVTLVKGNRTVSYWADSFSVSENRILKVYSRECGDISVRIDSDERLLISDVFVQDEFDEMLASNYPQNTHFAE